MMAQGGGNERQGLGKFVRNQSGYGTTVTSSKKTSQHRASKYIKHTLDKDDNLNSLSLKYQVTVEVIKRENKLWNNDMLFLRECVLIPITPENEHLADEDSVVTVSERDRSGSSVSNGSQNSDNHSSRVEEPSGKSDEGVKEEKKENPLDFFSKYDSNLAKLKSEVAKMEKNAEVVHHNHVPGRSMTHSLVSPYDLDLIVEKETEC